MIARPARQRMGLGRGRAIAGPGAARRRRPSRPGRNRGRGRGGFGAPAPAPWDSGAGGLASAALRNRENALAGIRGDFRYQQQQFGLGSGGETPYSQAAALKRQRKIGNKSNLNSAGLQLYSGSTINRARGVASAYDRGRQRLEADYARVQERTKQREAQARGEYGDALAEAREGALDRAAEQSPEPEPLPGRGRGRRPRDGLRVLHRRRRPRRRGRGR